MTTNSHFIVSLFDFKRKNPYICTVFTVHCDYWKLYGYKRNREIYKGQTTVSKNKPAGAGRFVGHRHQHSCGSRAWTGQSQVGNLVGYSRHLGLAVSFRFE